MCQLRARGRKLASSLKRLSAYHRGAESSRNRPTGFSGARPSQVPFRSIVFINQSGISLHPLQILPSSHQIQRRGCGCKFPSVLLLRWDRLIRGCSSVFAFSRPRSRRVSERGLSTRGSCFLLVTAGEAAHWFGVVRASVGSSVGRRGQGEAEGSEGNPQRQLIL